MAEATMNTGNLTLFEKRTKVKQFIDEGIAKTFPAYLFDVAGKTLKELFHLSRKPHWAVGAFTWFVVVYVPGLLVAIGFKEIPHWEDGHWFYAGILPFGYFTAVVCYVNVVYNLLPGIRYHIVDSILAVEDLDKLKNWLVRFWSIRNWFGFTMVAGVLIAFVFTVSISMGIGEFIGIGLTLVGFSVGPFFMGALYIIFYMLTLPPELATYKIKMYDLDPSHSEVIQRLASILIYICIWWLAT